MLPFCIFLEQYPSGNPELSSSSSFADQINATLTNPQTGAIVPGGVVSRSNPQTAFNAVMATILCINDINGPTDEQEAAEQIGSQAQWNWQKCTQLGYAQIPNTSSPINIASSFLNITEFLDMCQNTYPGAPIVPDVDTGLKYGGWNVQPSNVMFTDGLKDPWHDLSVHSTTSAYGPLSRSTTGVVPAVNHPPPGDDVFGMVYPDGYHTEDLWRPWNQTNASADVSTPLFAQALQQWLPGFKKSS